MQEVKKNLKALRQIKPLILNLTNFVTADFVANGLYSIGASPLMSLAKEELPELISATNAIVINIGTLNSDFLVLAETACQIAEEQNKPIILDPVGVGATQYRTSFAKYLLATFPIAIVRGNYSELITLANLSAEIKGVDSLAPQQQIEAALTLLTKQFPCVFLASGKVDLLAKANQQECITGGSPLMAAITGMGCLLSSVIAAFHAVEKNTFLATKNACSFYSWCGEKTAEMTTKSGSYKTHFIDYLSSETYDF